MFHNYMGKLLPVESNKSSLIGHSYQWNGIIFVIYRELTKIKCTQPEWTYSSSSCYLIGVKTLVENVISLKSRIDISLQKMLRTWRHWTVVRVWGSLVVSIHEPAIRDWTVLWRSGFPELPGFQWLSNFYRFMNQ